jgi:hypothetical protein
VWGWPRLNKALAGPGSPAGPFAVHVSCVVRLVSGYAIVLRDPNRIVYALWRDKRKKLNGSLILADPKLTRDDNPIISSGLPESHSPWTVRLRNRIRNENIQHFVPFLLVPYCTL